MSLARCCTFRRSRSAPTNLSTRVRLSRRGNCSAPPLELVGASGIIYFALPAAANPGFAVVLGVFVASFSIALMSHAPGGLGVLEFTFVEAMPDAPQPNVVAALLVFRLLYLILPLMFALVVVLNYERKRLRAPAAIGEANANGLADLDR